MKMRKRKLVVERSFQMRYALLFALTCFLLGSVSTLAIILFGKSYYMELESAGAFLTPTLAGIYHQSWTRLCFILGIFTIAYSGAAFYLGLVITRNIVGPVLAFRQKVKKMVSTGRVEEFELRSKDELQVLKEVYGDVAKHFGRNGTRKAS